MKIAVLGAGNGGQSLAGYLSLKGIAVNLYNRSKKRIENLKKNGGIYLTGLLKAFAPLDVITTDIKKAINAVDVIMVVVPAQAHNFIADICAPYLSEGQAVVLNPGRTGGALEFANVLKRKNVKEDVLIAEAQTFLFVSRVIGDEARISGIKKSVPVAALRPSNTKKIVGMLKKMHGSFHEARNVLETSLNNISAIFHPSTMIFNIGRIESKEAFNYYFEGITPRVAQFLEKIDSERRRVAEALGVRTISAYEWLNEVYNARGNSLYERIQDNGKYRGIAAPETVMHRYIFEDVPTGLVPMASLGAVSGVQTPAINSVIEVTSHFYGVDFRKTGRTVENLGLQGKSKEEIIQYVNGGV